MMRAMPLTVSDSVMSETQNISRNVRPQVKTATDAASPFGRSALRC